MSRPEARGVGYLVGATSRLHLCAVVQGYFIAVDRPAPWPLHSRYTAHRYHGPTGRARPVGRSSRESGVLVPDAAAEIVLHDLAHDREAHIAAKAEQALSLSWPGQRGRWWPLRGLQPAETLVQTPQQSTTVLFFFFNGVLLGLLS